MKYQRAPRWLRGHLEHDSVLRTNRPHRCRPGVCGVPRRYRALANRWSHDRETPAARADRPQTEPLQHQPADQLLPVWDDRRPSGVGDAPAAALPAQQVDRAGLRPAVADHMGGPAAGAGGVKLPSRQITPSLRKGHYQRVLIEGQAAVRLADP